VSAPLVSVGGFAHCYPGAEEVVSPDFDLAERERLLLLGPSGCGKSTLLMALAGLLAPSRGAVCIAGEDWRGFAGAAADRRRGRLIGFVPQEPHLIAGLSVAENVRLAVFLAGRPDQSAALEETLEALGIAQLAGRYPHALSRGQQQRVALARAVANRPPLLLADEPTASPHDAAGAAALDLLFAAADRVGAGLIVATHDLRVQTHFPRRVTLGAPTTSRAAQQRTPVTPSPWERGGGRAVQ